MWRIWGIILLFRKILFMFLLFYTVLFKSNVYYFSLTQILPFSINWVNIYLIDLLFKFLSLKKIFYEY